MANKVKPDMIPSISAIFFFKEKIHSGEDTFNSFIFSVLCKFLNTC